MQQLPFRLLPESSQKLLLHSNKSCTASIGDGCLSIWKGASKGATCNPHAPVKSPAPNLIVELGDEVHMAAGPPAAEGPAVWEAWAGQNGLTTADLGCKDPAAGFAACWNETQSLANCSHLLAFHKQKFGHDYGLLAWKAVTEAITDAVPEATVGANMSPVYSGYSYQFIRAFREGAMNVSHLRSGIKEVNLVPVPAALLTLR